MYARVANDINQQMAMSRAAVAVKEVPVTGLSRWRSSAPCPIPTCKLVGIMQRNHMHVAQNRAIHPQRVFAKEIAAVLVASLPF